MSTPAYYQFPEGLQPLHLSRHLTSNAGQATADLADNPIARGILLALVIALIITGGGAIAWQSIQHPIAATLTAGIILTTLTWRWTR